MIGITMIITGIIFCVLGLFLLIVFYRVKPLKYQGMEISSDERQDITNQDAESHIIDVFDDSHETVLHQDEKGTDFDENEETTLDTRQNEFGTDEETVLKNEKDEFGADDETKLH